jgi:predicted secreted acid phosphatase
MNKRSSIGLNIGLSSILVIIVILCLVCFAGLSVASSNADKQLTNKLSARESSYYAASSAAYRAIYEAKKESSSSSENSFDKYININSNQQLHVVADLNPSNGDNYEILCWQVVTVSEPELDTSLSLLLGD